MKKLFPILIQSALAGICISIGCGVFLSVENRTVGAALFAVGLFGVCVSGFPLYTGKVGYAAVERPGYWGYLGLVWLGNLLGTALAGLALGATRFSPALTEKAAALCQAKAEDTWLSLMLLSFFCGLLMFLAVDGYKNNPHPIGKYLGLVLCVTVFILCGFEHCVADMAYCTIGKAWSWSLLLRLVWITLGNSLGGMLIPAVKKYCPLKG